MGARPILLLLAVLFASDILGQDSTQALITPEHSKNQDSDVYGWAFGFYQEYISPAAGDRCLMYPSCSAYAWEAINRYGFFRGLIMTADRLMRCGNDLHLYDTIVLNGRWYALDPVEMNASIFRAKE
ncbi:MAG: membrane protein insertion efficiency factor YidD [Candidatus Neomarinimicrobiota bacterium]